VERWLAPAHLALTLVIIIWDVVLAGSIAQVRFASRPFATITGLAGLLLIPAAIVAVATTTVITGRAIATIDWIWPCVVVLFAIQAVYAVARRLVNPLWGYPIAFYNVLLAIAAIARYFAAHGVDLPRPLLVMMAAQVDALALVTTDAALTSPLFLHVPMVSPAFPALRRLTATFRVAMAALAAAWFGVIMAEVPRADIALNSYDSHADDRLRERPTGFAVGLKMFPDLASSPSAASVATDIETADSLGVNVASVVFAPGASQVAIDSVAHALASMQRDSLMVIATIGYHGKLLPELSKGSLDAEERLVTIRRVLTRLHPDIIIPAQDPYGIGARILGRLPVATWEDYLTRAAAVVREVRPRTRVGVSASSFDSRDSTLFAWAASPGSPMTIVGFSFRPSRLGARTMDASFRAADRWMRAIPQTKPYWVFSAGGYPLVHGEGSQDQAVWASLAWATAHGQVRGLVVNEANDYGQAMGVRAPNGRFRRVANTVRRSIKGLRESAGQPEPATPVAPTAPR
jgi:hypothetical protein